MKLSIAVYVIVIVLQEDQRECIEIKNSVLFFDKEKQYFNEIAGFLRASGLHKRFYSSKRQKYDS